MLFLLCSAFISPNCFHCSMEPNTQYHDFTVEFAIKFHRPIDVKMRQGVTYLLYFSVYKLTASPPPHLPPVSSEYTDKYATLLRSSAGSLHTTCVEETEASEPGAGSGQCRRLEKAPSNYLFYSLSSKTPNMLTLNGENKWKGKPSGDVCDQG